MPLNSILSFRFRILFFGPNIITLVLSIFKMSLLVLNHLQTMSNEYCIFVIRSIACMQIHIYEKFSYRPWNIFYQGLQFVQKFSLFILNALCSFISLKFTYSQNHDNCSLLIGDSKGSINTNLINQILLLSVANALTFV